MRNLCPYQKKQSNDISQLVALGTYQFIPQGDAKRSLFDPYSIAISKLDRGLGFDLEDVSFLIEQGWITFEELKKHAEEVLKRASIFDMDKKAFLEHLEQVGLE